MTPRQELIKVATEMKLKFKGNAKTETIQDLVNAEIRKINSILGSNDIPHLNAVVPKPEKTATYCGKSPITGEAVYK